MESNLVFLPWKSHGQRSLVDYSPWGHKRVGHTHTHTHKRIGHNLVTKQQQQQQQQRFGITL